MSADIEQRVKKLPELIVDAVDALDIALEERSRDNIVGAHEKVERVGAELKDLLAALPEDERDRVEMRFGRRVLDLKRQVALLPKGDAGGNSVKVLKNDSFIEQRAPGFRMEDFGQHRPAAREPRYKTGGEVDAWCGPCDRVTIHRIEALVGGEPTKVICQSCNGRHAFRTEPARKRPRKASGLSLEEKRERERLRKEAAAKEKERMALKNELALAESVRAFSPDERYKAGEYIDHPLHGRGKVETVMKRSLLVRFNIGLRPIDLH